MATRTKTPKHKPRPAVKCNKPQAAATQPAPARTAPVYLTSSGVAKRLGASVSTVARMRADGRLPAPVTLGPKTFRWPLAEFIAWLGTRDKTTGRFLTNDEWQAVKATAMAGELCADQSDD